MTPTELMQSPLIPIAEPAEHRPLSQDQENAPSHLASAPDKKVRIQLRVDLNYEVDPQGADFIFNIQATHRPRQTLSDESFTVNQEIEHRTSTDRFTGNRYIALHAQPGHLEASYRVTVDISHHYADPAQIRETPICFLPPEAMVYLYPSRYCQSDLFAQLANEAFGMLPHGYHRVLAVQDWVRNNVTFTSNSSNSSTSAVDTLSSRVGVCRDFAHLMITLCRALNIPARFASGTDFGADPSLGPPDFQAYVEVYLDGCWYIFDPSGTAVPMGFVRLGTGRDAADVAFATIFGGVRSQAPLIQGIAVENASLGLIFPHLSQSGLSTDT